MIWLGLMLPVCFWAGITGASIPTQWAVLSAVMPLAAWRRGIVSIPFLLVLIFAIYSAASIVWSSEWHNSIEASWKIFFCLIPAFWLGSSVESLRPLWIGLAIGVWISLPIAAFQLAGLSLSAPGLLFNETVLGATAALVIIGAIEENIWMIPGALLPLVWISHSRGAWLILGVSLLCKYLHWIAATMILVVAGTAYYFLMSPSDASRLDLWSAALGGLRMFGNGGNTFAEVVVVNDGKLLRSEFVHNDYLQLIFEYGIGSAPWFLFVIWGILQRREKYWPVFIAFAAFGLFWFPLFSPIPAFIGFVVAGNISRDRNWDGDGCFDR